MWRHNQLTSSIKLQTHKKNYYKSEYLNCQSILSKTKTFFCKINLYI